MDFHSTPVASPINAHDRELFRIIPCKALSFNDPLYWLWLGWQDFKKAPLQALFYGLIILFITYTIAFIVFLTGNYLLIFASISAFMWISPILAYGFYDTSRQLRQNKFPSLKRSLYSIFRNKTATWSFAALLFFYCFFWTQIAGVIMLFYPPQHPVILPQLVLFYGIGSLIGLILASVIFSISAFSMPLLMDRRVSIWTAMASSINVVKENIFTSAFWALIIFLAVLIGLATFGLGLIITLPIIGFSTWHAYRNTLFRHRAHEEGVLFI